MTNSLNKMAGKNSAERNGTPIRPRSTSKLRSLKATVTTTNPYISTIASPPRNKTINISNHNNISFGTGNEVKVRLSPSLPNIRTSPGLLGGHFAGCKWSDPPSPASLPKPPHHWTQLLASASKCSAFGKPQQTDIASQLKVLLNVQA